MIDLILGSGTGFLTIYICLVEASVFASLYEVVQDDYREDILNTRLALGEEQKIY